jgi:hypothetical protein
VNFIAFFFFLVGCGMCHDGNTPIGMSITHGGIDIPQWYPNLKANPQAGEDVAAYNVPLDLLREHREEIVKHLVDDVVLVCRSGQRAGRPKRRCATWV